MKYLGLEWVPGFRSMWFCITSECCGKKGWFTHWKTNCRHTWDTGKNLMLPENHGQIQPPVLCVCVIHKNGSNMFK